MRHWGIQEFYAPGRMIQIAEALKKLELKPDFSLVDMACGHGLIADGLKWVFPEAKISQFDLGSYEEWQHLEVHPYNLDVDEMMKRDERYDVVLFLNSYRNWEQQEQFNDWVKHHAQFFITSGSSLENGELIGMDTVGQQLKLYKL